MPTKSRPAALPLLSWQGPSLRICKEWINGGIFLVVSIYGVEFFTNTGKSLTVDICGHGIRIEFTTRPTPRFGESLSLFEKGIRNRYCGFHKRSITVVIPRLKPITQRLAGASKKLLWAEAIPGFSVSVVGLRSATTSQRRYRNHCR
jgi:hypothetical protein